MNEATRTTLYLIRHGESEMNREDRFAGHTDTPLTALGLRQAESTARFLEDVPFSAVYASDLRRAFATGDAVARRHGLETIACPGLREIYAGAWEGLPYREIYERYPAAITTWCNDIGNAACTDGETVAQLQQRIRAAIEDIVRRHPGQTLCIATHATPIRVMECVWRGLSLADMQQIPWVSNASVTIVRYDIDAQGGLTGQLVQRDLHEHLGSDLTVLPQITL